MYQKLTIAGNVGRDPEMRYLPDGSAVTSFSLATNRSWNDSRSGEKVKETTWFRVSVFGRRAEVVNEYVKKGSKILVEGRLNVDKATGGPRVWTAQDGTVRASFEMTAENFTFLGSANDGGGYSQGGGGDVPAPNAQPQAIEEDDIPF